MYVAEIISKSKKKKYKCVLLRESYRDGGKVKNKTIANLSHCKPEEIEAIKIALAHKEDLAELGSLPDDLKIEEGASVGAVWAVRVEGYVGSLPEAGPSAAAPGAQVAGLQDTMALAATLVLAAFALAFWALMVERNARRQTALDLDS